MTHLSTTLVALCLLGVTSAAECIPKYSSSNGFQLVVNVTDRTKDTYTPPVHGSFVQLAHVGPPYNRAVASTSSGSVFYQNGTFSDIANQRIGILTDIGTPPFPAGVTYQFPEQQNQTDEKGKPIHVNGGASGGGTRLTRLYEPLSYLTILSDVVESTFVVCPNSTIPYYARTNYRFNVVNWVQATRDSTGSHIVIPEGCVAVNLVPQCATLNDLPENAFSSHDFAQEVRCYDDVAGMDWN
ncbi:hypothetical protein B0H66DRAFT_644785 [Apodospora peruviana]|uniref:DUF7907 domain-containing protein n=1 Tax=Apodospora peruviana TaxID=516989 RepID=A0AAE0HU13_9PEZI|nr:hypothetical protein B0H66DRAFT_644785 [Apodospora peruviana]